MPIYEYQCKDCGKVMEVLHLGSREERPKCESCGSERVEKLLSSFSAQTDGESSVSGGSCASGTCPVS